MAECHIPLPSNRAFVVQFQTPSAQFPDLWHGRAEHLESGEVAHFHSPEQLWTFFTRVLTEVAQQPHSPDFLR